MSLAEKPIPAIPIDNEIHRDLLEVRHVLSILSAGLVVFGVINLWGWGRTPAREIAAAGLMVVVGLFIGMLSWLMQLSARQKKKARERQLAEPGMPTRPGGVLEYLPTEAEVYVPRTPFAVQATAGFVAWVIGVIIFVQVLRSGPAFSASFAGFNGVLVLVAVILIALGGLTAWLRVQFKWRGFLPGILLGLGVTCLLPVGILFVVCGGLLR